MRMLLLVFIFKDLVMNLSPDKRDTIMEKVEQLQQMIIDNLPEKIQVKFVEKFRNFHAFDVPEKMNVLRQSRKKITFISF
jgi:hypothetical protein